MIYSLGFDIQRNEAKCWVQLKDNKIYIYIPSVLEPIVLNNDYDTIEIKCSAAGPGPSQAVMFEISRKPPGQHLP